MYAKSFNDTKEKKNKYIIIEDLFIFCRMFFRSDIK